MRSWGSVEPAVASLRPEAALSEAAVPEVAVAEAAVPATSVGPAASVPATNINRDCL